MKKSIVAMMALALMIASVMLTGCGGGTADPGGTNVNVVNNIEVNNYYNYIVEGESTYRTVDDSVLLSGIYDLCDLADCDGDYVRYDIEGVSYEYEGCYSYDTGDLFNTFGEVNVELDDYDEIVSVSHTFHYDELSAASREASNDFYFSFIDVCESELGIYDGYEVDPGTDFASYICYFDDIQLSVNRMVYDDYIEVSVYYNEV